MRKYLLMALLPAAILLAPAGRADPVTEVYETWTNGLSGWTNSGTAVTLSNPGGTNRLEALFSAIGSPDPAYAADLIRTYSSPATNWFTGDFSTSGVPSGVRGVEFSFYASNVAPANLEFKFAGTSGNEWYYTLDTPTVGQWESYDVYFDYWRGWVGGPGADENQFLADLQSVDWVGVYIERSGLGEQIFLIDDMKLTVPEPGQICLLLCALVSMIYIARKSAPKVCCQPANCQRYNQAAS